MTKRCLLIVMILAAVASNGRVDAEPISAGPDPALCRNLVKAVPDADVAYQPGVDVNGKAVAAADLSSATPQPRIGQALDIPITVNLAQSLGLNAASYPYNQFGAGTEGVVGTLQLRGNRVFFNGQPLDDAEQDRLAVLCMTPR